MAVFVGHEDLVYGDRIENIGGKPGISAEDLKAHFKSIAKE